VAIIKTDKMEDTKMAQETNGGNKDMVYCYRKVLDLDNANCEEDVFKECCIRRSYVSTT
jgi:hypothetical protein